MTRTFLSSIAVLAATLAATPSGAKGPRPASYVRMVRQWHQAPPLSTRPLTPGGRPALVLEMINTGERVELVPERDDGGFGAAELERASEALRDHKSGESCPVDPRLLDLVYQIELHFDAPLVRVISGYRTPHRRHSNHSRGRAIDLVVPGVADGEVAKFARRMGFVGVGVYPASGFIHLDTRPQSYFWVDASGPGRRSRSVQVFAKLAAESDAKATARGEAPPDADEDTSGSAASDTAASATFTATAPRGGTASIEAAEPR